MTLIGSGVARCACGHTYPAHREKDAEGMRWCTRCGCSYPEMTVKDWDQSMTILSPPAPRTTVRDRLHIAVAVTSHIPRPPVPAPMWLHPWARPRPEETH